MNNVLSDETVLWANGLAQQLGARMGAETTDTFYDVEEQARVLAQGNPCLVPEMGNELYDCCGSDTIEHTCTTFGSINAALIGLMVLSWGYLIYKNDWFRSQLLLSFVFLF